MVLPLPIFPAIAICISVHQLFCKGTKFFAPGNGLIVGRVNSNDLKNLSKKYDCTVTQFISAVMLRSIYLYMKRHQAKNDKPLSIVLPVNMRKYYNSETLRNFALYIYLIQQVKPNLEFNDFLDSIKQTVIRGEKKEFSKSILFHGIYFDFGILSYPLTIFFILAVINCMNLIDGLDGLAGGLSVVAFLALGIISWGSYGISGSGDIAVFCFILVGSLMGFLVYNTHPAKVFMGDTGSLALGATLASVAILTRHEVTFIIISGVFIFETLVCLIQIISMIYFKKKVFLMTPYHHHLEKLGWDERDIVKLFLVIGLVLSMAAITFGVWI